ncbi:MAG: hypothetical protein WCJ33_02120 [Pseudomonadota bacterium]
MRNNIIMISFASAILVASSAFAQEENKTRVNQIENRIDNQEQRINKGIADGNLTKGQARRDERRTDRVEKELKRDEAKHDGHITKREEHRMNNQLNHNSEHIHHQNHEAAEKKRK